MLSASDWQRMRDEMAKVRTDRSFDVEFRRGDVTLDAQEVRIEAMPTRGFRLQSDAARAANRAVVVFGATDLDVAIDDRFTLDGILYRIVFISPNRDVDTQAEAIAIE
jgi:hypothetical protein